MKHNQISNVKVFFGAEGIKKAYMIALKTKKMNIKCLSQNYKKIIGNYFDDQYWPKVLKTAIKTREIILNTEANRRYANNLNSEKNQAAFVEKSFQSESDFIVGDKSVTLISFNNHQPFAIVINDEETVKSMKAQFELMWKTADK